MSTSNTPVPTAPTAEFDLDEQGPGVLFEAPTRRGPAMLGSTAGGRAIVYVAVSAT